MDNIEIKSEINRLKKEHNAVIVAHNYQVDEVQEIADVVGDSFALSQYCVENKADVIVFCGVHFMAESAKILSPEKMVLLPERDAGCPMANMVTAEALIEKKKQYPQAKVVCYINSTAQVKALSDVCCTSSNAVAVIQSIVEKDILFVPDQNLGSYVAKKVPEKNIILWDGYCITHHRVSTEEVVKAREMHPDALFLVHPECKPEIVNRADFVGSTKQILEYAKNAEAGKFVIGTEMGILYQLKKDSPDKTFYLLTQGLVCPNMKKTSLESVYRALSTMKNQIELDEDVRIHAKDSLLRMLAVK